MKVNYLHDVEIEEAAASLLREYEKQFNLLVSPPVPIDEIVECYLGLDLRFENLTKIFHQPNILGAIWIEDKQIAIDESLDPSIETIKLGRYRFTLAHETGHWILHRHYFLARLRQPDLFASVKEPSVVCRNGDSQPIEWQANAFAGCILMPKEMIYRTWQQIFGSSQPYNAAHEIADINAKGRFQVSGFPSVQIAREMAKRFEVSSQAMQIRLLGMKLIRVDDNAAELFTESNHTALLTSDDVKYTINN